VVTQTNSFKLKRDCLSYFAFEMPLSLQTNINWRPQQKMKRTSIKQKTIAFLMVFFILTLIGIPSMIVFINHELGSLQAKSEKLSTLRIDIEKVYAEFSQQAKNRKNLFLRGEKPKDLKKYIKRINNSSREIYEQLLALYDTPLAAPYVKDLKSFEKKHRALMSGYQDAVDIFVLTHFDPVKSDAHTRGKGDNVEEELSHVIKTLNAEASKILVTESANVQDKLFMSSTVFMVIYVALLILLFRTITAPIARMTDLATYMISSNPDVGDEYSPYSLDKNDEIGDLIQSFNDFSQTIIEHNKNLEDKVNQRTTDLNQALDDLEGANKQMVDSIEYASLIQNNFIPSNHIFQENFKASMIIWEPRDIVGGDIYFLEKVGDIIYIIVIDCVGHGVSGAFVTMLVKAIKDQIFFSGERLSSTEILNKFHHAFNLIAQGSEQRLLDVGFDGTVLQVDKVEHTIEFAGANIGLFSANTHKVQYHKGTRQSIGFKKDTIKKIESMKFSYDDGDFIAITTDGFIDQLGGKNSVPFGRSKFTKILENNLGKSMDELKSNLLHDLKEYQGTNASLDDKTVLGIIL